MQIKMSLYCENNMGPVVCGSKHLVPVYMYIYCVVAHLHRIVVGGND